MQKWVELEKKTMTREFQFLYGQSCPIDREASKGDSHQPATSSTVRPNPKGCIAAERAGNWQIKPQQFFSQPQRRTALTPALSHRIGLLHDTFSRRFHTCDKNKIKAAEQVFAQITDAMNQSYAQHKQTMAQLLAPRDL